MTELDLRFDGPIPKYLRPEALQPCLLAQQKTEEIYRIKQTKRTQFKKMFVYPSKNHPISQHEKKTETKGQN